MISNSTYKIQPLDPSAQCLKLFTYRKKKLCIILQLNLPFRFPESELTLSRVSIFPINPMYIIIRAVAVLKVLLVKLSSGRDSALQVHYGYCRD